MFVLFVNMFLRTMNSKTFFWTNCIQCSFHTFDSYLLLIPLFHAQMLFHLLSHCSPASDFKTLLRLLARLADINKLGLQTGSTDKEPINILCLTQFATVLAIDGTTIDDTG